MSDQSFYVAALTLEDVPAAAVIAHDTMEKDRQTEMKTLGEEPFDMGKYTLDSMPGYLQHPRVVVLKAVDKATGEVIGVCNWGFRGFKPHEMPVLEGRTQPEDKPAPTKSAEEKDSTEETKEETPAETPAEPETDPIKRLEAFTDKDMNDWMEEVMPEGTQCIYVVGLSVSPRYQRRGVGSALLKWGTDFCDERGVFAWVHSSEGGFRAYEKAGFEVIRTLDVDLDEYAPVPPPNEGPDAKWGHYVFRYMKYFGKKA